MKQTNDNETVREVCAKMLEPSSTCRACDFTQCPMLVRFSADVKEAHAREIAAKDAEIARLKAALKPVMECGKPRKTNTGTEYFNTERYVLEAYDAVREAQRVMREGGEK